MGNREGHTELNPEGCQQLFAGKTGEQRAQEPSREQGEAGLRGRQSRATKPSVWWPVCRSAQQGYGPSVQTQV